jgi:hypothetical protein
MFGFKMVEMKMRLRIVDEDIIIVFLCTTVMESHV